MPVETVHAENRLSISPSIITHNRYASETEHAMLLLTKQWEGDGSRKGEGAAC